MLRKIGNIKSKELETTYIEGTTIPSIRYHIFRDIGFVKDGFSTRAGGVSSGQFESMNFSIKMGDSPENVRKNFEIFLAAHRFRNPVMSDQTHTTNIKRVYLEDAGKNVFLPKDYSAIDGLVTNEKGVTLVTTFADCVPLYFADMKNRAIGLAHSGWKGAIGRIGRAVIQKMRQEFGTEPENIKAAIGPSICVNCYEVSRELAGNFAEEFQCEISEDSDGQSAVPDRKNPEDGSRQSAISDRKNSEGGRQFAISDRKNPESGGRQQFDVWDMEKIVLKKDGRYYLNLWAANYRVLTDAGIPPEQIALPDLCTCCNHRELFSHRASRGKRGNLCAFFMIEE